MMSVLDHQRQDFLPLGTSAAWALPPAPSSMSPCTPLAPHSCLSRFSLTRGKWQAKRGSLPCVCSLTAGSPWSTVFSYLFFLEMVPEHRPPTNWAFCPWPQQTSGSLREVDLSWGKELSTRELRSWDCVQLSSLLWPFYSGLSIPSRILETLPLFLSSAHTAVFLFWFFYLLTGLSSYPQVSETRVSRFVILDGKFSNDWCKYHYRPFLATLVQVYTEKLKHIE